MAGVDEQDLGPQNATGARWTIPPGNAAEWPSDYACPAPVPSAGWISREEVGSLTERDGHAAELAGASAQAVTGEKRSDRALVVVDMVESLVRGDQAVPGAAEMVRYVRGEVRYFRERGRPVLFAYTEDKHGAPEVIQELTPRANEIVLVKRAPSAFFGTGLDELLRRAEVRRLTLVGLETATSILLTAADAYARGYEVVVPDPCVSDRNEDDHRFALHLIRDVWRPAGIPEGARNVEISDEGRPISAEGDPA